MGEVHTEREAALAGGIKAPCRTTEFAVVRRKDREAACEAVVLPGETEILLGAYPFEGMDLVVHPQRREVTGARGDTMRIVVK
ncbi:MAG: hypothetical protein LBK05_06105 [Treponema sp.]|jgi:hypothetical protein|nr:hypothetical protein [Treponema sp.]